MPAAPNAVLAASLLLTAAHSLGAQLAIPRELPWSISVSFGGAVASSSSDVEDALRAGGFDDNPCPFCPDAEEYPSSGEVGVALAVTVGKRLTRDVHASVQVSRLPRTETDGHRGDLFDGASVTVHQRTTTATALVGYSLLPGQLVWVAGGPTVGWVSLEHVDDAGSSVQQKRTRVGAAVEIGTLLLQRGRLFLDLHSQYRLLGSAEFGAVDVRDASGNPAGTIPAWSVSFNHFIFLLGAGIRL